jgi:hypothetical protein
VRNQIELWLPSNFSQSQKTLRHRHSSYRNIDEPLTANWEGGDAGDNRQENAGITPDKAIKESILFRKKARW